MTTGTAQAKREDVRFSSGDSECAAWLYRPTAPGAVTEGGASPGAVTERGAPCVVMAHGFSLTRHEGLDEFAQRFATAGLGALAFDHRHLGDSGGEPRQRFRKREQLEDWRNAIAFARATDGIDAERIVLWGFSFSGGHVVTIAQRDHRLAAVLALCPFVDGLARVLSTPLPLVAWVLPRALVDSAGRHTLIAVTGPPGSHAAMTLPGEAEGFARVVSQGSPWRNEISPGLFATVALHRPLAGASRIACPLWVGLGERDVSVSARAVQRLAERAPQGQLQRYPYDHFEPFLEGNLERVAGDQIGFLRERGVI
jgi:dienelactone hydrolase